MLPQGQHNVDTMFNVSNRTNEPRELHVHEVNWDCETTGRAVQWVNTAGDSRSPIPESGFTICDITDSVVYPYAEFLLCKPRSCYCYKFSGNTQEDANLIITASDKLRGVTVGDFWRQLRGLSGTTFFECNHAYLEGVSWSGPGVYRAYFGS